MSSQFVDLNGDGHLDYLTATFDGSPHVSYGSDAGFTKPQTLMAQDGQRIIISSFWNYQDEAHQVDGRAVPNGEARQERLISALAFDWDDNGVYDLLLGSYENGRLYRQMNEGSNKAPKFTGKNISVMVGDVPFALSAKMTTPRLVDWDGDGDLDLLAGTFGDSYGNNGMGGGIYLALNQGKVGAPKFGSLKTLIEPSRKGHTELSGPDLGLYPDAVDYDGDGDLDLIVGAYSIWVPVAKKLTAEEQIKIAALKKEQEELRSRQDEIMKTIEAETAKATKGLKKTSKAYQEKSTKVYETHMDEYFKINKKVQSIHKKVETISPGAQRKSFVWFFERLGS